MTTSFPRLAVCGAEPAFQKELVPGQFNVPAWDAFEASFRDIFHRRYYTNHGPLARELERRLAAFFEVKHAVCMVNSTIGMMIALKAANATGKVIVPAYCSLALIQSARWAGLEVVGCDLDAKTFQMDIQLLDALMDSETTTLIGSHPWGRACSPTSLEEVASRKNRKLLFDASHAAGARFGDKLVANFGSMEVFSFHETCAINGSDGACVCTNDDHLAARLRNIRSSYGSGPAVPIPLTGNGRLSEAQAAIALLSLEQFESNRDRNRRAVARYVARLENIPGLRFVSRQTGGLSNDGTRDGNNYEQCVVSVSRSEFGLTGSQLCQVLKRDNVDCEDRLATVISSSSGSVSAADNSNPVAQELKESIVHLPLGHRISDTDIDVICDLIWSAHREHEAVAELLRACK